MRAALDVSEITTLCLMVLFGGALLTAVPFVSQTVVRGLRDAGVIASPRTRTTRTITGPQ